MNTQRAFIFIGRSGSGKGTQAKMLREKMEGKGMEILRLELGDEFRNFWNKSGYTPELSAELKDNGSLQPEFLAISIWSQMLIDFFNGEKHLVADGVPRRIREAKVLDGALRFYGIQNPTIIYVDIPREEAKRRMLERARGDDQEAAIEERLDWFDIDVRRTLDYLENDDYYHFLTIDGVGTPEEIHDRIMARVQLD